MTNEMDLWSTVNNATVGSYLCQNLEHSIHNKYVRSNQYFPQIHPYSKTTSYFKMYPKPSSLHNAFPFPSRRSTVTTRCAAVPGSTLAWSPNRCSAVIRGNTTTASPCERGRDHLNTSKDNVLSIGVRMNTLC